MKNPNQDWNAAEEYLKECEQAYSEIGSSGAFAMAHVINPCRDRFNKGDRGQELFNDIMDISL